jgi:tRNA(Ser,Leu) C12 N-acetylase TAN1
MEKGNKAEVDFEEADMIIIAEMVSNLVGIALLTKEVREKYPSVRVE